MSDTAPILGATILGHVLVVDDEVRLRQLLRRYLSDHGYRVTTAGSPKEARAIMAYLSFDVLVVDVMMPGESGFDFVKTLRRDNTVPVLMLTAQGDPERRIHGLEQGADDYMGKPFEPRELLLRLGLLLRRAVAREVVSPAAPVASALTRLGAAVFDRDRQALTRDGEAVHLTTAEAALLAALAAKPGVMLSRDDLASTAGMEGSSERTVDVQVTRLRRKIEADPREPRYLHTIRGKGYVLRPG